MGRMKRLTAALALIVLTAAATLLVSCQAGPGCWERTYRNGESLIECR